MMMMVMVIVIIAMTMGAKMTEVVAAMSGTVRYEKMASV